MIKFSKMKNKNPFIIAEMSGNHNHSFDRAFAIKNVYITQPILPAYKDFCLQIKQIYKSGQLTNSGQKHNEFEEKLKKVLAVNNVSLFNNGTIALLTAIKALDLPINSEVITTPWTFAATPHCIAWNGLKPVFCDIEPDTMCINPDKIEKLITKNTSAILGVHVYGFPCDVKKIGSIAKKYNLKVIYDAAHAFSTEIKEGGGGIGNFGDITMFSFHATKLFHTLEGGCLTYNDKNLIKKVHDLRNFGICNEDRVEDIGINGKMNEIQAAMGLLNLKIFEKEKNARKKLKEFYDSSLSSIKGIRLPAIPKNISTSYQYYPIILENIYPITRNNLYEKLKQNGIYARKYFYPSCNDYECYKDLPSSRAENLPVVNDIKEKVLCLPFYGALKKEIAKKIVKIIIEAGKQKSKGA
ncbi:MAG: aminotransferase class I/II-fold pyridoxal phosphate-dependent enzyme [Endomicrobium sp.]|jgi:dTDP-4-amino-4,6-dideoxygalactose transaminase|nr:aminotransferase class I/II-fold pyridoxal phosphate-dependent enzyme [Endomicrobium sp.]